MRPSRAACGAAYTPHQGRNDHGEDELRDLVTVDPNADLIGYTYTDTDQTTDTVATYTVTETAENPQYVNVVVHYARPYEVPGRTYKTVRATSLVRQHKASRSESLFKRPKGERNA